MVTFALRFDGECEGRDMVIGNDFNFSTTLSSMIEKVLHTCKLFRGNTSTLVPPINSIPSKATHNTLAIHIDI